LIIVLRGYLDRLANHLAGPGKGRLAVGFGVGVMVHGEYARKK